MDKKMCAAGVAYYNQDYTKEQIDQILDTILECIRKNNYSIEMNHNRQENVDFRNYYWLTSEKQKQILLNIQSSDFCHSLKNTKPGYEHETLFVFCPQMDLISFEGISERVDVYIKFNIIDNKNGKRVVTISLHNRNKPIIYLFR